MAELGNTAQFFDNWIQRTREILLEQLKKNKIGLTEELQSSIEAEMIRLGEGFLRGEFAFLVRGRFVDMGKGRKRSLERQLYEFNDTQGRKPKKWYSKPFYGRLNDLEGAIGFTIMEEAIDTITKPLKAV